MTRVLLVDDASDLSRLLARQLTRAGFEVCCAASLAAALAAERAGAFDVVVTDLNLADGDGVEVAQRLGVPVRLLLTGSADRGNAARLAAGKFAAILLKPMDGHGLASAIREAIDARAIARPPAP